MRQVKERPADVNQRALKVKQQVTPHITTRVRVTQVDIFASEIAPICSLCGSFMNLVPFRVSSPEGLRYNFRWVCGNHDGEGNCPAYALDGKQVIDIPKAGEGA